MPLAAISLLSLLGIAALAIDVGYLFVVRNELQNAADAAALAGAHNLVPYTGTPATPNWANAEALANNAISLNRAVNADLVNGQVATGYWDITGNRTELNPEPLDANDLPAVMVTIQRAAGNNGGPVNAFFAQVLGINTFNVPARGVAVRSSPSKFGPAVVFPVAISTCMYENYWDVATDSPKTATSTSPAVLGPEQTLPQVVGQPYKFMIGSDYHTPSCDSGQWTSLNLNTQNVPTIRGLIANGNPDPLGINDNIWIQSGTENTLYTSVNNCSASGDKSCEYVLVSVVEGDLNPGTQQQIMAFACIHIDLAIGGSKKYIQAEMVATGSNSNCIFPNSSGVSGLDYGVLQPPKLVNYGNNNLLRW
jgi:hypothetical protein